MWKIEKNLYNRVKSHYDNCGGMGSYSGHFEKLPLLSQTEIISLTGINNKDEDVLFASYLKNEYLVVITNKNLYWLSTENIISIKPLVDIKSIHADFKESAKRIRGLDCLRLETNEREQFTIRMEAGKTLSSMHNVLLLIANLRK